MATARRTADHDEIRDWVESRGGRPAIVEGTDGMLRIDFDEPDPTLEETDWDTFFRVFDRSNVDFLYNPDGGMVKFVDKETPRRSAARRGAPRKTSGRKKSSNGRKKSTSSRKKSTSSRKKSSDGRKKTSGRKKSTSTRKKSSGRKKTTGRKKSTTGRKKTAGRKKSTTTRKKSSGRKKTTGRKKSTNGRKKSSGRKYGKKASKKVGSVMHEYKHGSLKSGRSGRKVKNRKQAIAIGISEARREGDKVPKRRGRKKK